MSNVSCPKVLIENRFPDIFENLDVLGTCLMCNNIALHPYITISRQDHIKDGAILVCDFAQGPIISSIV